jgi:DNA-binding transcriptional regulator PaaX
MKKYLIYKGLRVNAFGIPVSPSNEDKPTRYKVPKRKYSEYKHFIFCYPNSAPRDQIIICDIPSNNRSDRDWLRYQLKKFDYSMIKKNVWVGPSPLPIDFLTYIKSIGILPKLRILQLAKPYLRVGEGK